jgi:hypothetical protein
MTDVPQSRIRRIQDLKEETERMATLMQQIILKARMKTISLAKEL